MESKTNSKVIKPPVSNLMSGKIFKPSRAFLYKSWTKNLAIAITIWALVMISYVGMASLISYSEPEKYSSATQAISEYISPVNFWTIVANLIWLIPVLALTPRYVESIEYSVKAESGETMPEIYVKKGILTITRKHVPFRTITNIESKTGPFDRLFGIGNVSIETAGYSGNKTTGPEEKLEGILFFEEVRDYILNELRRFRAPYTIGTEVVQLEEEKVPRGEGLDDEILITLREIRDLLKSTRSEKKLD
jgi:membrane protein YdbS with pleckstrin-like domain